MPEIYVGEDAFDKARRMARYGHRDWFVWRGKDGLLHTARATDATCKMAMLACGTQKRFYRINSAGHTISSSSWRLACIWLSNLKMGW